MFMTRKRRMTEKNLAAHRRNARLSQGPVTPEGLKRSRVANLRHGFYAEAAQEVALRALGEDPRDYLEVLEALRAKWRATDAAQDRLVTCLARALWRIDRADRIREGHTLRQAKEANDGREPCLHAQMMRLKMTADCLRSLAQAVAQPRYVATVDDLKQMKSLQQDGAMREMGDIALALIYQLREPGTPGPDEPLEGEDSDEKTRRVMNDIRAIFGLSPLPEEEADASPDSDQPQEGPQEAGTAETEIDDRYPHITPAQWEVREPVRQLLENILLQEVQIFEARRKAVLKELVAGPSPYERAAEITPTQLHATLMQKLQDTNLQQAARLMDLLVKMKRQARETDAEVTDPA
jgi:hypothetical protein